MRIDHRKSSDKDKKKKERRQSTLESEIFNIMEKSLKTALDMAIDDIFKEWK